MKEKIKNALRRVKQSLLDIWHTWYVKYVVVCTIGVMILVFFDENSVLAHLANLHRIDELKSEIEYYEEVNRQNKEYIDQLETNPKAMEKIARERYFMKADDEDIFVLGDDEPLPATPNNAAHETAQ